VIWFARFDGLIAFVFRLLNRPFVQNHVALAINDWETIIKGAVLGKKVVCKMIFFQKREYGGEIMREWNLWKRLMRVDKG
jgi:hypothetical protein